LVRLKDERRRVQAGLSLHLPAAVVGGVGLLCGVGGSTLGFGGVGKGGADMSSSVGRDKERERDKS
jgi:hypothetical protein